MQTPAVFLRVLRLSPPAPPPLQKVGPGAGGSLPAACALSAPPLLLFWPLCRVFTLPPSLPGRVLKGLPRFRASGLRHYLPETGPPLPHACGAWDREALAPVTRASLGAHRLVELLRATMSPARDPPEMATISSATPGARGPAMPAGRPLTPEEAPKETAGEVRP